MLLIVVMWTNCHFLLFWEFRRRSVLLTNVFLDLHYQCYDWKFFNVYQHQCCLINLLTRFERLIETMRDTKLTTMFQVLFSPDLPFKIGHNLLQELAEQFLFYTHSIHQVNKGLQVGDQIRWFVIYLM